MFLLRRPLRRLSLAILLPSAIVYAQSDAPAPPPSAAAIMARVATLQDHAQAERARYVYVQHATVSSRRGHTIHCQEITDIRITPSSAGSHEQLLDLSGRLLRKGRYVDYHSLDADKGHPEDNDSVSIELGDDATDRDMVENMRKNLLGTNSKDGINANLFPLTTKSRQRRSSSTYAANASMAAMSITLPFAPKTSPILAGKATHTSTPPAASLSS